MKVLCVIPARGGSKSIPRKNLATVAGISLVGHAVLVAREVERALDQHEWLTLIDTDDEAIADEGESWGATVPFLRNPSLATDETSTVDSVLALLERLQKADEMFDVLVLLQPTSPLRSVEDVLACWNPIESGAAKSSVAVTEIGHVIDMAMTLESSGSFRWVRREPPGRRQDSAKIYRPSGAVYISDVQEFLEKRAFMVPGQTIAIERPKERSVDVDQPVDLAIARALRSASEVQEIDIAGRTIGTGQRCFVIAEAGVNHNGDSELACRLLDIAAEAGADAVKFQTFEPELLAAPDAPRADYQIGTTGSDISQVDMLRQFKLPFEVLEELRDRAKERGIVFLSTPFDLTSAAALVELGVPALKIGSGEITNHPLLRQLAGLDLPLLMSTGMSDIVEVAAAVAVIQDAGDPPIALFHCVTNYPATVEDCNLKAMDTMRAAFKVPVGWSDHTEGINVAIAAVARGAALIEKHFTTDKSLPGPDHAASLEPAELHQLIRAIRQVQSSLGNGRKEPARSEAPLALVARRSLHVNRRVAAGSILEEGDLIALRPGSGISPARLNAVVGRRVIEDLPYLSMLSDEHLQ